MSTTAIQVAFPKVDTGADLLAQQLAPLPTANLPATVGLQAIVKPKERKGLRCSDLLEGDTRRAAEQEAAKKLDEMLANSQVLMTYGTQALEGVNDLIDRLLKEGDKVKIPELTALMKELNDGMRSVKRGYDVSNPKVREKYEEWKGGIGRFFRKGKSMIEMLMEDVSSMEKQLDKVVDEINKRKAQLVRNVGTYDELYAENEAEIVKVIYAIGVMELIRDLAVERAKAVVVGDASLGDRGGEQKATMVDFASNMEAKIAEYKARLFVAWATSPQTRTMRTLNVGLAMRLNELVNVVIPTMKGTVANWRLMMQTKEGAELAQLVQDSLNDWLVAYADAGAEVVPVVAELVQTPSLLPQTVFAMADSIARQTEGIMNALSVGFTKRAELDESILQAKGVIDGSAGKQAEAFVDRYLANVAQRELEVRTSVLPES